MKIQFEEFQKIKLCVLPIKEVVDNKSARKPSFVVTYELNEKLRGMHLESFKKENFVSSAQITVYQTKEQLMRIQNELVRECHSVCTVCPRKPGHLDS